MRKLIIAFAVLILLSACAPARQEGTQPFEDQFTSASGGWTLARGSQADIAIGGGRLTITVKQPDSIAWSVASGRMFDNFVLEVDAVPLAGPADNDYGVVVRHVDEDNFYRFDISGDGYYNVQKRVKGQWQPLVRDWTASGAIHKGSTANHLRVICAGNAMSFYANGALLAQVVDDLFPRGEIGLLAGTLSEPGVQVAFSHLRVNP